MKICCTISMLSLGVMLVGCAQTGSAPRVEAQRPAACEVNAESKSVEFVSFGEASAAPDVQQVKVEEIIASPDQYNGKTLRISGTVQKVCAKKGCWLQLGEGDEKALFVKFTCPIDGRLIPMEAVGKPAVVEGTVKVIQMSEDSARHYKEDAGASPEEIAKIVGPQKRVTIAAPAAKIAGL